MQDIVIEFPMEDLASTGSGDASVGHKCYVTLPAGCIWELQTAYFYTRTSVAKSATNYNTYRVCNAAGTVLASLTSAAGLSQYNAMTLGSTVQVDASSAVAQVYADYTYTNAGQAPPEGLYIVTRWKAVRSGAAA